MANQSTTNALQSSIAPTVVGTNSDGSPILSYSAKVAAAKASAGAIAVPQRPLNFTTEVPLKSFLPFIVSDPRSCLPIINGWHVTKCRYAFSDCSAGVRKDEVQQLMYHFPQIRPLGYELTQVTLTLFSYDDDSYAELQQLHESIYPSVPNVGSKTILPKVVNIQYPPLKVRSMEYFIPIKGSTSALIYEAETGGYTGKYILLQWNPVPKAAFLQQYQSGYAGPTVEVGNSTSVNNYQNRPGNIPNVWGASPTNGPANPYK